jgi:hypothetical protein
MKLEYLPDCPLIRLYDFTTDEAAKLLAAVESLASGGAERIEVHDLPFVNPIGGCRLAMVRRSWDQAIIQKADPANFECGFTAGTWDNVAALVEPFVHDAPGFQWLAGIPGEADLLLSVSGQW